MDFFFYCVVLMAYNDRKNYSSLSISLVKLQRFFFVVLFFSVVQVPGQNELDVVILT